jgi:hypothetical protein
MYTEINKFMLNNAAKSIEMKPVKMKLYMKKLLVFMLLMELFSCVKRNIPWNKIPYAHTHAHTYTHTRIYLHFYQSFLIML